MRAGWYRFWSPQSWREWSGDRRAWTDHRRAHTELMGRLASANAEIRTATDEYTRAERNHRWVSELRSQPLPIRMKKGEVGLGSVADVALLETRRRDGQDVWTVVDHGAVRLTDRRLVFDGGKEVSFPYVDISTDTVEGTTWTLGVTNRKRLHMLRGPVVQMVVLRDAVVEGNGGTDPRLRWKNGMETASERRAAAEAAHAAVTAELDALGRPVRPFSPAWVPAAGLAVIALTAQPAPVDEPVVEAISATTSSSTTTTTRPQPEASVLGVTVTTEAADTTVRVVEVLAADTLSVRFDSGERATVHLAGLTLADGFEVEARQLVGGIVAGADVELVEAGPGIYYAYVGETLINTELVRAGVVHASAGQLALATLFDTAAREAEQSFVGMHTTTTSSSTTTTSTSTTTTTTIATTTTTEAQCHPSYEGACVPVGVSDVDCAGGSGNGPYYVGRVSVVGYDEYDLDRDGDGVGCE